MSMNFNQIAHDLLYMYMYIEWNFDFDCVTVMFYFLLEQEAKV